MRIPEHIAVIPDGNRRWAVAHGMAKGDGYHYGLRPGLLLLRRAKELGIREITYYGFTVDNCKRPSEQVGAFRRACVDAAELLKAEGADFLVLGNTKSRCFPEELKEYRVRKKVGDGGIRLNFLVNYGWEWDLAHMKKDGRPESWDVSRIDLVLRWEAETAFPVCSRSSLCMPIFIRFRICGRILRKEIFRTRLGGTIRRMLRWVVERRQREKRNGVS